METTRPPYAWRNALAAGVFVLITLGYWSLLQRFNAEAAAQNRNGYEGEASFLVVIPLLFLLLGSGTASLALGIQAMRRRGRPVPAAPLLLTLLPLGLLLLWWRYG